MDNVDKHEEEIEAERGRKDTVDLNLVNDKSDHLVDQMKYSKEPSDHQKDKLIVPMVPTKELSVEVPHIILGIM